MFGDVGIGLERRENHSEVIVLQERSGVLTGAPRRLTVKPIDFCRQVEFKNGLAIGGECGRLCAGSCGGLLDIGTSMGARGPCNDHRSIHSTNDPTLSVTTITRRTRSL